MNYPKFSVLMSLYIKENYKYFQECMDSILSQTILPDEIVIVFDGPISDELNESVNNYINKYPGLIKVINNKVNKGLGLALADGINGCTFDLVARMDTDDIARSDRFEKQLNMFIDDKELDICGSHIIEFEGNIKNELSRRKVPLTHNDILKYQKQRSAFNHMTVMYKKSAVLKAGNYEHCPLMEDDMMWIRMILAGAKCANIDDYLVYARTGYSMIERRGGWAYFKKYRDARKKILNTGYISKWDYFKTIIVQLIVSLLPKKIRLLIFTKLLR
ncbi:glycosyltransferase [uncultured Anaerococcus sp.]|uniref:glycosyltransferase n=1 Tax=uncultured Anaerococcus sp. TaxID=293428 RepID=UPI00288BF267|nr:glycosyltransferase [uncultured Anaerococcus sp.]